MQRFLIISAIMMTFLLQEATAQTQEWTAEGVTYKLTTTVVNGSKVDHYQLFIGALLIREFGMQNGYIIGLLREYNDEGKLVKETTYASGGLKNGIERTYHSNGQLESEVKYIGNQKQGVESFYSKDGRSLGGGAYLNDQFDGAWLVRYSNGNTMFVANYVRGKKNGAYKEYYEDGSLKIGGRYMNDNKDGSWVEYHSNGKLASRATYKNGLIDGKVREYNKEGALLTDSYYRDDEIIVFRQFHNNGQLAVEYRANAPYVYNYDETGKLTDTEDAEEWMLAFQSDDGQ